MAEMQQERQLEAQLEAVRKDGLLTPFRIAQFVRVYRSTGRERSCNVRKSKRSD
jgi:hypothetical protein